jgi:ribosomal protein S18 acetylase RimI-like enzyme
LGLIRDASEADVERVAEIKVRNWADTYAPLLPREVLTPFLDRAKSEVQLRELLGRPDVLLLVGPTSGEVHGFSLTYLARPPEPWLESLHVMPEARGRGLGTLLIRATATRLLEAGFKSMSLGVILGNDAAGRLYARLGGSPIRVEPVAWAPGVQHTVWRWPDEDALRRLAG